MVDELESTVSFIRFPGDHAPKIVNIACGGEHLIAVSKVHEVFSWGRNDDG